MLKYLLRRLVVPPFSLLLPAFTSTRSMSS